MSAVELSSQQLDALADRIAARLTRVPRETLVPPGELAQRLGVSRAYVYEHAAELGAMRLPGGALRFDIQRTLALLDGGNDAPAAPRPQRRERAPVKREHVLGVRG